MKVILRTKVDIMNHYWNEHGVASSAAGMARELRLRFPNKQEWYIDECNKFIGQKKEEMKANRYKTNILSDLIVEMIMFAEQLMVNNNIQYTFYAER